jgi:hypothetical protein
MLRIVLRIIRDRTTHMPMPVGRIKKAKAQGANNEVPGDRTATPPLSEAAKAALAILLGQAPPAPSYGGSVQCRTGASDSIC